MKKYWPSKQQFYRWSLPSKVGFISFVVTILSILTSVVIWNVGFLFHINSIDYKIERIVKNAVLGHSRGKVEFIVKVEDPNSTVILSDAGKALLGSNYEPLSLKETLENELSFNEFHFDKTESTPIQSRQLRGQYYFVFPLSLDTYCQRHAIAVRIVTDTLDGAMRRPIKLLAINLSIFNEDEKFEAETRFGEAGFGAEVVHAGTFREGVLESLVGKGVLASPSVTAQQSLQENSWLRRFDDRWDKETLDTHRSGYEFREEWPNGRVDAQLRQTALLINPDGRIEGFVDIGHHQDNLDMRDFSLKLLSNIAIKNPQLLDLDLSKIAALRRYDKSDFQHVAASVIDLNDSMLVYAELENDDMTCQHG